MKEQPKPRVKHPCTKECPERTATCKRTCKRWKEYEPAKREEYKERQERSEAKSDSIQLERDRWKRGCTLASYKDPRR